MSWTNIKSTGRGKLEFRLMIEGWPYEFVSHLDMEQTTADYRIRVAGLDRAGIVLEEQCKPHLAETEGRAITFRIVDRQYDDAATAAFFTLPTKITWLATDVTTASTTFAVLNNTALWGNNGGTAADVFHIGTEAVLGGFVGATDGDSNPTIITCTRGYWDTIPQAHYTGDPDDGLGEARITDQPLGMEGRRAYLYVYGEGDSFTGDGTLVWRGICSTDARLTDDGASWEVSVDPIFRVLEQELGADIGDISGPRGIYYPSACPLVLYLNEASDANYAGTFLSSPIAFIYGFYPDQDTFLQEVQAALDAETTTNTYTARSDGDNDWWIECHAHASTPKFPYMGFISPLDGTAGYTGWPSTPGIGGDDLTGARVVSVNSGTTYRTIASNWATVPGQRTVPRGYLGDFEGGERPASYPRDHDPEAHQPPTYGSAYYSQFLIFPSGTAGVTGLSGATIEITRGDATEPQTIETASSSPDRIQLYNNPLGDLSGPYTRDLPLEFTTTQALFYDGDLDDVRDFICDNSPTETNRARLPFITGDDGGDKGDLADWTTIIDAVKESPITTNRYFHVVDAVTLAEYFREEWRLLGVFPALDSEGRITLRSLSVPLATDAGLTSLTASEHLIDDGYATWERNAWGTLNAVKVALGYNPREDEYREYVVVRDKGTYPNRKAPKMLEIEPKSHVIPWGAGLGRRGEIRESVIDLGSRVLGIFGRDYAIITAGVPLTVFDTLVGDKVLLTLAHVPDGLGGRGLTNEPAVVVGRRWDLDHGRGEMSFLVQYQRLAGYTPAVQITAETDNGGNEWSLTVSSADPNAAWQAFQSGHNMSDHFAANDLVKVRQWNTTSPTTQTGTVVSVTDTQAAGTTTAATGTIVVQLDGAATLSATTWILGYDEASTPVATGQQAYAYFSDPDALVTFSSDVDAFEYSG